MKPFTTKDGGLKVERWGTTNYRLTLDIDDDPTWSAVSVKLTRDDLGALYLWIGKELDRP